MKQFLKKNIVAFIFGFLFLGLLATSIALSIAFPRFDIKDLIDTTIVIKVASEKELDYFYIETNMLKVDELATYYHTDYIGVDEFHTYYSLEYLTAVKNNEILQIVEVAK